MKALRATMLVVLWPLLPAVAQEATVWDGSRVLAKLVGPGLSGPMERIVPSTLNCYLSRWYGWQLPPAKSTNSAGLYILAGNAGNNPGIQELVSQGLSLNLDGLGPEGFRLFTHQSGDRRFVIVAADTAAGLKHGCQELVFYHLPAHAARAWVEWPLDLRMKPQFGYRATYMLPCWAQHDSIESWQRVLRFNSELTLNRNWFWLDGFPLLPEYGGEYAGTDLADPQKVRGLIDLCRSEGMKFYIGGGWFTWHHEKAVGTSIERGMRYYLDRFKLLPNADGIYLEPPGEGYEVKEEVWKPRTVAMQRMMEAIWRCRPDFELSLAIGSFNAQAYRQMVHSIDEQRIFWWWCWGDPIRDNVLSQHPLVVRWHTVIQMSGYHGSIQPPGPQEIPLTGMATSYDPGMGFGNPWNGGSTLGGAKGPRNFDPYTMPYFSHEYWFRERCWNVNMTSDQFSARLARRLFDADMPSESTIRYLNLANFCPNPAVATEQDLDTIESFVNANTGRGTARNRDTLSRMREALDGIRKTRSGQ